MPKEKIEKQHLVAFLEEIVSKYHSESASGVFCLKIVFSDGGILEVSTSQEERLKKDRFIEKFTLQTQKIGVRAIS